MPDREVKITFSAKNLTTAEFKKVRAGLAGIGSSAKGATTKTSGLQRAFSSFGKAAPGVLKAVTKAAAAAGVAITGLAVAVIKLGERGAMVADVTEAFNKLSVATGETGAVMLGALAQGVKGTLTNFELMKVANKALGTGLLKSADDARTMGQGARMLAKRMGIDTVTAFERLTGAMASGRTAQLKQLGLFVDNIKACKDYAKANGITYSSLTDLDRATALQAATLEALRGELANNAPPLADFGELIAQGKVAVMNLVDGLAVMISKSPPLIAGMHAIQDVIGKAFGGDQETLILGIVNVIEKAALMAIEFGQTAISVAGFVSRGFAAIKGVILAVQLAFVELGKSQISLLATVLEVSAKIPVMGKRFQGAADAARTAADFTGAYSVSLQQEIQDTAAAVVGNDAFGQSLTTASGMLDTIKTAMVNAGLSQREFNTAVGEGKTAVEDFAPVLTISGESMESWGNKLFAVYQKTQEKSKVWSQYTSEQFIAAGGEQGAQGFAMNVVGVGDVVALQTANMTAAFASFGIQTKTEMATMVAQLELDFLTIKNSGLATDKDLATSAKKLAEAKKLLRGEELTDTMSHHEALVGTSTEVFNALGQKYKAASIAGAIISTYSAIAKALGAYPWPFNLVAAAAAAAAGWMNVSRMRGASAYREGTANLDYQDFGKSSPVDLHGREAVIPQGSGHHLAEEIAAALARHQRPLRKESAAGTAAAGGFSIINNFDFSESIFDASSEDELARKISGAVGISVRDNLGDAAGRSKEGINRLGG